MTKKFLRLNVLAQWLFITGAAIAIFSAERADGNMIGGLLIVNASCLIYANSLLKAVIDALKSDTEDLQKRLDDMEAIDKAASE